MEGPQAPRSPRRQVGQSALVGQLLAFELDDALAIVLDGLRGDYAALVILELAVQFVSQLAGRRDHHVERLLGMTRARQAEEKAHGAGAETLDIVQVEGPGLERIGHGEQHLAIAGHAFVTVEDIHLSESQTAFEDVLQQRRALEALVLAGDHADHQHFLHGRQGLALAPAGQASAGFHRLIVHRIEQGRHRLVQAEGQVALLRLDHAATATVQLAGAQGRQVFLVELGFLMARQYPRRPQQRGVLVIVRQVGEAAIQPEFKLALATAHTPPAIEEDASDNDDADDDQPLAQTDFHVILCLSLSEDEELDDDEERARGANLKRTKNHSNHLKMLKKRSKNLPQADSNSLFWLIFSKSTEKWAIS